MSDQQILEQFNGNQLAVSVWKNKYKKHNDVLPSDTIERFKNVILENEKEWESKLDFTTRVSKTKQLSKFGATVGSSINKQVLDKYVTGFNGIFGQGSVLATVGVPNSFTSISNCFVIDSPTDSYAGIMKTREEMVQLMKRRGGVGFDLSTLRPRGVKVANSAQTSTGAASFMEATSALVREVAQEGRRGALMLTINVLHPDALEFIKIKQDLTKVTGANISVFIPDEVMVAAKKGEDVIQRWPIDTRILEGYEPDTYDELVKIPSENIYLKKQKASELLDAIVECAWNTAEPGSLYLDRHLNYNPDGVYENHRSKSTNPCGEQFLPPYDSCRLFIKNLLYSLKEGKVDFDLLYEAFYVQLRIADSMVDVEIKYIDKIIQKLEQETDKDLYNVEINLWKKVKEKALSGRRVGCGFTALGDMIALSGFKYDSDEALELVEKVMRTKLRAELDATIDLAILRGPFKDWDKEKEYFISDGKDGYDEGDYVGKNQFYDFLVTGGFGEQVHKMQQYGRRNVNWSTVAPTGSMSILSGTTSGLEPMFSPFYGRYVKITDSMSKDTVVARIDDQGDKWYYSAVIDNQFRLWIENQGIDSTTLNEDQLTELFNKSPWFGSTANEINWTKRVQMQAVIQKYTTNSISSTLNLPKEATIEDVRTIYLESWKQGLKGVTVYRDGCRDGVLVSNKKVDEGFNQKDAFKRPTQTTARIYHNVIIGEIDNKPYEVFYDNNLTLYAKEYLDGFPIVKQSSGNYSIICENNEFNYIETTHNDEYTDSLTRMVSMQLRHGVHSKFIVEQLLKVTGLAMTPAKAIAKALSAYITEEEVKTLKIDTSDICLRQEKDCQIIYEEGCIKCLSCGNSKC